MKFLSSVLLSALLIASPLSMSAFDIGLGPFYLSLGLGPVGFANSSAFLDDPICYAISAQKRIELRAEAEEVVSPKEKKWITKTLIVEPYAFGFSKDRRPILLGNVVEEKLVKEITAKFAEDRFATEKDFEEQPRRPFFSGWFRSNKNDKNGKTGIDIRKINQISVLESTHFDAPKEIPNIEEITNVICRIPPPKSNK